MNTTALYNYIVFKEANDYYRNGETEKAKELLKKVIKMTELQDLKDELLDTFYLRHLVEYKTKLMEVEC